ncbi:MAG: hypothetical protein NVSMB7_05620 [Chitinophagaceae bacterium]
MLNKYLMPEVESPIRSVHRKYAVTNTAVVILTGLLTLLGWQFDITIFTQLIPGLVSMNPMTALAFIFSGAAFLLLQKKEVGKKIRYTIIFLAVLISLIGISWLLADLKIYDTGIGRLLFAAKTATTLLNNRPNIMAPVTAFNFVLTGLSLLLLSNKKTGLTQYLSMLTGFTALLSIIGYAYGVSSFYGIFSYFPMAVHTAICFLLLSTAILFVCLDNGFMAEITSPYGGGKAARVLLPMAIFIPIILGMIRQYGEKKGLYGAPFGLALFTTAYIVVFTLLIWKSLAAVNQSNHLLVAEMVKHKKTQESTKKIYRQLQQLMNSMQKLMHTSMDVICIIDQEGQFVEVSATCEKLWGYTAAELTGRKYIELVHEDDRSKTNKAAAEITVVESMVDFENRYWKKDGTWVPVIWTAIWSKDDKMIYGIARDGTERKKTEQQLKEYNQRISNILESITDGFLAMDKAWLVTYWNKEAEHILGMAKEDIIGKNLWDVFVNTGTAAAMQHKFYTEYHRAVAEQVSVHFEAYVASSSKWLDVNAYPSEEGLSVYFKDITSRKKEEEHLRLLESVITNATDTVIITEAETIGEPGPKIIFVNEAFTKMTGYTKEEVMGKSPRLLQGPKSGRVELDRLRTALENGESCEIEVVNYKKNGEEFWVNMAISPGKNNTGIITYFIAIERDITEHIKNLQAIKDQNKQLLEIAWMQSHVARAPLARIMGLINLQNDPSLAEKDKTEILQYISLSAHELDDVIRKIVQKTKEFEIEPKQ